MAIEDFDQVTIAPAKLRPFSKFIMSIGELPTSYLDSLSYAEQVTWFCDYLQNNVIPALNNNAEALEEVQNLMTQLQEYVDNYFTNLDVTEEINNKLDQMASDGTLTNLIKNYIDPIVAVQDTKIENIETKVNSATSGSPLVASSTSGMTDTDRIYVNTTDGYWYYYNGEEWTQGGVYQGTTAADSSIGVSNLKNELKNQHGYSVPVYTETSGSYIDGKGIVQSLSGYRYTSPIQLKRGQTIQCIAGGSSGNVAIFSETDSTASAYYMLIRDYGDNTTNVYKFTAPYDMYVACSYRNSLFDSIIIYNNEIRNDVLIDSYNNLITQNDTFLRTDTKLTYSITPTNDKIFKNELNVTIDSDGTVATGWNWYLLRKFNFQNTIAIKKISAIIDIKTTDISNCIVAFTNLTGSFINSSQVAIKGINNLTSGYKRYFFEIDCNVSLNGLCFGIANRNSGDETDGTVTIRYMGVAINQTVDEFSNNMLTTKDIELINAKAEEVELFDSFLSFGAIGDSLASGESVAINNGSPVYVDNYDYSWGQFIARKYGMTCINFSKGGATTRSWLTGDFGLSKLLQPANKCNAYIIGLGVNDANILGPIYIGSSSDIHVDDYTQNADTFYGNYGKIISNIKIIQPKAKIFLLTIPESSNTYTAFNTAISTIATLFDDVYLIDLHANYLDDFTTGFVNNNRRAGHYNATGYNYISDIIYNALSDYMYNNYSEFKQIEFIGTDYNYYN